MNRTQLLEYVKNLKGMIRTLQANYFDFDAWLVREQEKAETVELQWAFKQVLKRYRNR